ncbi:MAG TPA: hypothetical protein DGB72_15605 [Gemmatimonadetes bacterium]|nr:hypothetical protein [Gemmatimonadota bacterium]
MGYATLICSGPRTSGTGGSFGLAGGRGAGTSGGKVTGVGTGADGPVTGAQDALATATQQAKPLWTQAFIVKFQVARAMRYTSF